MKREYTTTGKIKEVLEENYKNTNKKMSFTDALLYLKMAGKLSSKKIRVQQRKVPVMVHDSEFEEFMLDLPVFTEEILSNTNSKTVGENIVIPFGKDVFAFHHLPYVNDGIHEHNYFEINYVYRGFCKQIIIGEERILNEGEFSVISPFTKHSVIVESDSFVISIMVRKTTFDAIFGFLKTKNDLLALFFKNTLYETVQSNYILFFTDNNSYMKGLVQNIVYESNCEDNYSNICCNSSLQLMFCTLLRCYSDSIRYYGNENGNNGEGDFTMILQYINQNYQTVTLKYLADFFHYSEAYLSKLIKHNMKENFIMVVQNIKMRHAVEYLSNTRMTIGDIAEEVGYDSVDYFTRNFKKHYNCTPSEYRKKVREYKAE